MADVAWWSLHAVQASALVACTVLAFVLSRRIGSHTPYGGFLFTLALAFWFLLCAEAAFLALRAGGLWDGPGRINDALNLLGWTFVGVSFALFAFRFRRGSGRLRRAVAVAGAAAVGSVATLGALRVLAAPVDDPDWTLRAVYLALDGATLGIMLLAVERMYRLRESSLGRLYLLLAAGLVLKTIGDLAWAYLAAREATSWAATAAYPLAGVCAVAALATQARILRRPASGTLDDPALPVHARAMRDLAVHMGGLAGPWASRLVLEAGSRELASQGVRHDVVRGTIHADASAPVWAAALDRAIAAACGTFGEAARPALERLTRAYGDRILVAPLARAGP